MRLEHGSVSENHFFFSARCLVDEFGRLIAIMLGRFRMTVPDCMLEYETLASKVFSRPQILTTLNFGLVDRTKYKAKDLQKVFEDVTERRSEQTDQIRITFPTKRGLCQTLVPFSFPLIKHNTRSEAWDPQDSEILSWYFIFKPLAEIA